MWKLLFFVSLFVSINAFWSNCNIPGVLAPDHVESQFCNVTNCFIERGQTLTGDAWWTPIRTHVRLDLSVTAFIAGIGVPLPVPPGQEDVCAFLYDPNTRDFLGCPTVPNLQVIWKIIFEVPATLPPLNNARVRYEFRENGVLEFCAEVTATLT